MNKIRSITAFLQKKGWIGDLQQVRYLASGEYNENYLVQGGEGSFVFRLNHGSQLNIDRQIEYEFNVLKALEPSGVTPRAYYYELDPAELAGGVLLMEYLPGRPLDYARDTERAAGVLARIHRLPPSERLLCQGEPLREIAAESLGLIRRFPDHPLKAEQKLLLEYHQRILELAERTASLFRDEPPCMVNTEVNSHNFLVQEHDTYLVDWEKAVNSCRYQDLGHFVVPTTTLWKGNYRYSAEERLGFLEAYRRQAGLELDLEELSRRTEVLEKTILLRALSWCYMAYYEYMCQDRTLRNEATLAKIKDYLDEVECFLR